MDNIVKIKRAVKNGEKNPNGFTTEGMESAICDFIQLHESQRTGNVTIYESTEKLVDDLGKYFIDIRYICGRAIKFDDEYVYVNLTNSRYKDIILENIDSCDILINYIATSLHDNNSIYKVDRVISMSIRINK